MNSKLLLQTESASGLIAYVHEVPPSFDRLTRGGQVEDQDICACGLITTTNTQSYAHAVRRAPVASSWRCAL